MPIFDGDDHAEESEIEETFSEDEVDLDIDGLFGKMIGVRPWKRNVNVTVPIAVSSWKVQKRSTTKVDTRIMSLIRKTL